MGLGRCIALSSLKEADQILQGPEHVAPVFFSFNRFDAENPKNPDEMMQAFPRLHFMLPEVTLIENEKGSFLQVNSLGPVYKGRVDRFVRHALEAKKRERRTIPYTLIPDELKDWEGVMELSLNYIHEGRIDKLVPSRRQKLVAQSPFSSKDLLVNLIDGSACALRVLPALAKPLRIRHVWQNSCSTMRKICANTPMSFTLSGKCFQGIVLMWIFLRALQFSRLSMCSIYTPPFRRM